MSELAISARGLGKRYRRITSTPHNSLRDVIAAGASGLFAPKAERDAKHIRESFWALQDATFDIAKGENVGIIGLNGAGKSTLLKLLSRITTPTTGEAKVNGRLGALLEVGTGFHGELSGRENTYLYGAILGMSRKEVARKYDAIVDFAEIADFMETPVKRYSSGMYVRLAFAVAAHLDPDILLLDEVLAVGDFAFQRKCMNFARQLEQKGATILFVSHNMFSIKTMCERVIYLKKGRVVYDGATDAGLKLYEDDSKLQTSNWFHDADQDPAIVFTNVQVLDKHGAETGVFDFGDRMRVRLTYRTTRPIQRPDVRISIARSDEVHCATYSTIADNIDIPVVDGEGVIEMTSAPISLVSDLYNLSVLVRENAYGRILAAQIGAAFHVRHPVYETNAFGVFHENGEWRLEDADAPRAGAANGGR